MKTYRTRFDELGYCNPLTRVWRFTDLSTGRGIGPFYATRAELLADMERFASVFGCGQGDTESVEPASWKR